MLYDHEDSALLSADDSLRCMHVFAFMQQPFVRVATMTAPDEQAV